MDLAWAKNPRVEKRIRSTDIYVVLRALVDVVISVHLLDSRRFPECY